MCVCVVEYALSHALITSMKYCVDTWGPCRVCVQSVRVSRPSWFEASMLDIYSKYYVAYLDYPKQQTNNNTFFKWVEYRIMEP